MLVLVFGSDQFGLVCFVQTDLARCQIGVESIGVGVKCLCLVKTNLVWCCVVLMCWCHCWFGV